MFKSHILVIRDTVVKGSGLTLTTQCSLMCQNLTVNSVQSKCTYVYATWPGIMQQFYSNAIPFCSSSVVSAALCSHYQCDHLAGEQ